MRIDELLGERHGSITERQYKQIKEGFGAFVVNISKDGGWRCERAEQLTKDEALQWLNKHWKLLRYETKNGINPTFRAFNVFAVEEEKEVFPDWPEELQSYNTDLYPEAYLCNKYDIERPNDLSSAGIFKIQSKGEMPEV